MEKRRILGIDPGYANTGFGVIDVLDGKMKLVGYGVIETDNSMEHSKRLLEIYNGIELVIQKYQPNEASMEELYFGKNASSAMQVSEAKGVITMTLEKNSIPLEMFRPNQIKTSVTGTQSADKDTVERYVQILLKMKEKPQPDHAADALAAAITLINNG